MGSRAGQRADHEAEALSYGWRGCRRCADIDEREVITSRRGRMMDSATDCERPRVRVLRFAVIAPGRLQRAMHDGRDGDRA